MQQPTAIARLQEAFTEAASRYTADQSAIARLWQEIQTDYSQPERHYHNLMHLHGLLETLLPLKDAIADWPAIIFALCYHDLVYDVLRQDNEEKSAARAAAALHAMGIPDEPLQRCCRHILATKGHAESADGDTDLFTDADLAIMGAPEADYTRYAAQIRQEYALFPDPVYGPGRCRVLQHFLDMPRIYKTAPFADRYEAQARRNLTAERNTLQADGNGATGL